MIEDVIVTTQTEAMKSNLQTACRVAYQDFSLPQGQRGMRA